MSKKKRISGSKPNSGKSFPLEKYSSDGHKVVWVFDMLDRDGPFAFNLIRSDFDHKEVLSKVIDYSNMTWSEIKVQSHDRGKSKHHFLDYDTLSQEAKDRIAVKLTDQDYDRIFSFAFQNKLRIIGIRTDEYFHAIWYDPEHQFCPSSK